jgi:hypothetical protein
MCDDRTTAAVGSHAARDRAQREGVGGETPHWVFLGAGLSGAGFASGGFKYDASPKLPQDSLSVRAAALVRATNGCEAFREMSLGPNSAAIHEFLRLERRKTDLSRNSKADKARGDDVLGHKAVHAHNSVV